MKDHKTMSYNAGYDIDLKGYDKETGTITKTGEEMINWYNNWINKDNIDLVLSEAEDFVTPYRSDGTAINGIEVYEEVMKILNEIKETGYDE